MRPMRVVVGRVLAQHPFEVFVRDDQGPVETLAPNAADPALGVCLGPWRRDRRSDHSDPLRAEDLVEGGRELAVAVADHEARLLLLLGQRHDQVARLLGDPGAVWVGGDAGEMHAASRQFDEEEDVKPSQPERLDREEITLKHPGGLLAEELSPARARSSRCRLDAVAAKDVPDAAGRQWNAESDELAMDPLVSPGRILRREAQDELSRLCRQWWTTERLAPVGPAAADELAVPAQQRRRLDEKRPLTRSRQHLAERRQHGAIGCLEAWASDLGASAPAVHAEERGSPPPSPARRDQKERAARARAESPSTERTGSQAAGTEYASTDPTHLGESQTCSSVPSCFGCPSRATREFLGPTGLPPQASCGWRRIRGGAGYFILARRSASSSQVLMARMTFSLAGIPFGNSS